MSQLQLAKIAGCSGQVISNIERSYTKPTTDIVHRIASHFKISADYILGLSEERCRSALAITDNNEIDIIEQFRRLTCEKQEMLMAIITEMSKSI